MHRNGILGGVAVALALVVLTWTPPDVRATEPRRPPDLAVIEAASGALGGVGYTKSPAQLIKQREPDVIVTGAIERINRGRGFLPAGEVHPMPNVVMCVRVDETLLAGEPGRIHDGRVYVELRQGPIQGADGSPSYPLSQWREALPAGTTVMLFLGDESMQSLNDWPTEGEYRGRPDGAELLTADPQGLIFEYDGELVPWVGAQYYSDNWDGLDSIAEISASTKKYFARR